jgi:hypothetical protein
MATTYAKEGVPDEKIKLLLDRWSSDSYLRYIRV